MCLNLIFELLILLFKGNIGLSKFLNLSLKHLVGQLSSMLLLMFAVVLSSVGAKKAKCQ